MVDVLKISDMSEQTEYSCDRVVMLLPPWNKNRLLQLYSLNLWNWCFHWLVL